MLENATYKDGAYFFQDGTFADIESSEFNGEEIEESDLGYRIRKLTPLECFRLMGFSDEDFYKAAYDIKNIEGDLFCNAKLKDVIEKESQDGTEICALNITNALQKLAVTSTEWTEYLKTPDEEKNKNINIAIEKLGKPKPSERAINIIKCIESAEVFHSLAKELDLQRTAIIELGRKEKQNTEKYIRIASEESLSSMNLFTILTMIELIAELKIYTSTLQKVNIQGRIENLISCENNTEKMLISDLKMEGVFTRVSSSQLYKQAGNSIVVDVLYYIFMELQNAMPYLFEDLRVSSYFSGIGAFESALDKVFEKNSKTKQTNG